MRITLDKPHTHAGKELPAGTIIEVNAIEGEWLCLREVGHRTTPADLAKHANATDATAPSDEHAADASIEAEADHTQAGA